MKLYIPTTTNLSRAMLRVENALRQHSPYQLVPEKMADVVVVHAIGYPETLEAFVQAHARGQRVILIQYCVRSTQQPSTHNWLPLWREALCVWSYYDLFALCRQDGASTDFNFYLAPLGVDADTFKPACVREPRWSLLTSGYVAESETVREACEAVRLVSGRLFHLGPSLCNAAHVTSRLGISDVELAQIYSSCHYVAGLRRAEGFELPAAEGLLCGAQPILYDRPHYRIWHQPWGRFIPEGNFKETVEALRQVLSEPPENMTRYRWQASVLFDWRRIVQGLWESL